jgi:hypothetical protein
MVISSQKSRPDAGLLFPSGRIYPVPRISHSLTLSAGLFMTSYGFSASAKEISEHADKY